MQSIVTISIMGDDLKTKQVIPGGVYAVVQVPNRHLFSAGQSIPLIVGVVPTFSAVPQPGDQLIWGIAVGIQPSWDLCIIPSNRPLYEILQDVVDHTAKYPMHGAMCSCMDTYSREIRLHISKAMPPDTQVGSIEGEQDTPDEIHARVMASHRMAHVMSMATRDI